MRLFPVAASMILLLAFAAPSYAQGLSCSDFHQNQDGSWSANHPVAIGGPNGQVQIGPGVAFRPGAAFMGVDLGATLNAQCAR